jgi:hypothetical protein
VYLQPLLLPMPLACRWCVTGTPRPSVQSAAKLAFSASQSSRCIWCAEAAHFLLAYLLAVPVVNYDVAIGREHTDLAEAKLQVRSWSDLLPDFGA